MIDKLQFISQENSNLSHLESIRAACEAGVSWIQLRVKDKPAQDVLPIAQAAKELCNRFNARLIINDYPEVALEVGAYGIHLGKQDMPVPEARKIVGNKLIIGATANTFEDIWQHAKNGANYIGLGPFRFTTTKKNLSPILGKEGYQKIMNSCTMAGISIPIIAIGGIEVADIRELMETGVHGIAISSLIAMADNRKELVDTIYKELDKDAQHA